MEIGINTFTDVGADGAHGARLRNLVAEIEVADQMAIGAKPHDKLLRTIELLGTKVAPLVKEATA